ncbi:MAG: NAD-dependent malic enzyme [Clostridiales bacterium]|jgi:malate dehydrogenase (oxaloacetate-decarboxylating)|nr:NAD-dependent malic enzyme [Clostridiales bacterium]
MNYAEMALKKHYEWRGKIEVICRAPVTSREELSLAYTPGVAQPCLEIQKDQSKSYELTRRANLVAVITDGTAVLGLGDIGPEAAMPVMEGKCALFKAFADIDAFPLCVRSKDIDEIVRTIELISGSFGGINLEDISAPRCFEIERRLKEVCDIPIFHDDQHGTAVVTSAALINAMKLTGRKLSDVKIVISGIGAAGTAILKILLAQGAENIIACDRSGILSRDRENLSPEKREVAAITNPANVRGTLADAMRGADVFIGVSAPGCVTPEMVRSMAPDPIILAMANPVPEIMPDLAKEAGAAIVGTGRSDFPNQINNVLAFPGIFRGALDVRASDINEEMKIAAANAIAECVSDEALSPDCIIPSALDRAVAAKVAAAVADAARKSGVARI